MSCQPGPHLLHAWPATGVASLLVEADSEEALKSLEALPLDKCPGEDASAPVPDAQGCLKALQRSCSLLASQGLFFEEAAQGVRRNFVCSAQC